MFRESLAWLVYNVSDGRWIREKRKAANKADEVWGLIPKVLECMLRSLDLLFSVDVERISMSTQKKVMIRNTE